MMFSFHTHSKVPNSSQLKNIITNFQSISCVLAFADYVVGERGCWQPPFGCDRNRITKVDGRCAKCDGPKGQPGYCCRADGRDSACSSTLKSELVKGGALKVHHYCIYEAKGKGSKYHE